MIGFRSSKRKPVAWQRSQQASQPAGPAGGFFRQFVSRTQTSVSHAINRPIFDPSMDAVSESHTNFGTRFPRQKLMPYLRILVATTVAPPLVDFVRQ